MRCIYIYLILKRLPVNTKKTYKYTSELLTYYIYVRQGKLNNEEFDPGSG